MIMGHNYKMKNGDSVLLSLMSRRASTSVRSQSAQTCHLTAFCNVSPTKIIIIIIIRGTVMSVFI